MPSTINGIGTWYWGKKNIHAEMGTCEFCGKYGQLTSYDTTLFFVIVFLPIIPLSQKRVLSECPFCRRHNVLKLTEWKAAKAKDIAEASQVLKEDPDNPKSVKKVIETLLKYQDRDTFLASSSILSQRMQGNAEVMALIGVAYDVFSHPKEAENAYRISLAVRDDQVVRQNLAVNLIKQLRSDEAFPFLQHIASSVTVEKIGYMWLLVEGYQAIGQHAKALEIINACEKKLPVLADDKDVKKYRKISEKNLASGKSIKSAILSKPCVAMKPASGKSFELSRYAAYVSMGLIVLGSMAAYLGNAYTQGKARTIFVVNGLSIPYVVQVNGKQIKPPPYGNVSLNVPEGKVTVNMTDPKFGKFAQTYTIKTPFFLRPFLSRTFVINPDKTAVVIWEETFYAEKPSPDEKNNYTLHTGKILSEFKDVDYEFVKFPETIQLSSKGKRERKTRVSVYQPRTRTELFDLINARLGKETMVECILNSVTANPSDVQSLGLLSMYMKKDEFVSLLRTRLNDQPLLIDWHRYYQESMLTTSEDELVKEYRGYLANDTNNMGLVYLLARIINDRNEAVGMYRKVADSGQPVAVYGCNALAYYAMAEGRFEEGLELYRKVIAIEPGNLQFMNAFEDALFANGKYDELLDRNKKEQIANPMDGYLVDYEICLHVCKNEKNLAKESIDAYCSRLHADKQNTIQNWRDYFEASRCYFEGRIDDYYRLISSLKKESPGFIELVVGKKIDKAVELLDKYESKDSMNRLLIYLAASLYGSKELAEKQFKIATEMLDKGTRDQKQVATMLNGKLDSATSNPMKLTMSTAEKRIVMAAMSLRFPQEKEKYSAIARKMNYSPFFPYHLVKEVIAR